MHIPGDFLAAVDFGGTGGAIFGPVGDGAKQVLTLGAYLHAALGKQCRIQYTIQRQDSGSEPFADQRVCDALRADTFLRAERPDGQHDMSVSESIPAIKPIPASSEPNAFSVSISPSRTSSMAQVSQYRENRKAASALFFLLCQPAAFLSCREILEDRLCRVLV